MPKANSLGSAPDLSHNFFSRQNGYSTGIYAGLNCGLGSGDDHETVMRNRNACAEAMGVKNSHLLTLKQEHTPRVVTVSEPWSVLDAPIADAMVTAETGLALGILTADCAPVLFADVDTSVIGAAHAGWKGALDGVIAATVEAMTTIGATREKINAVIGPCIGFDSYEVGPEFKEKLIQRDSNNEVFFKDSPKAGHTFFNLEAYVADQLSSAGIGHIESLNIDTYTEETQFYSYRRTCHRNETGYGRQLSAIALLS